MYNNAIRQIKSPNMNKINIVSNNGREQTTNLTMTTFSAFYFIGCKIINIEKNDEAPFQDHLFFLTYSFLTYSIVNVVVYVKGY